MNKLSRSTGLKIAAVLLWTMAIVGIIAVGIPVVTGARADFEGAAFGVAIFSFAVDSITILVAYGVWRAERWGVILAIIISAFNALLNTMGAIGDPNMWLRVMAGSFVFAAIAVIYLCLRRDPAGQATAVQGS